MRTLFVLSSAIMLFSGCSKEMPVAKEPVATAAFNGEPEQWTGTYNVKLIDNAHSGKAVAFVDANNQFSLGYSSLIENITKSKMDSLKVTYWILFKNNKSTAKTVMSIDNLANAQNIVWTGIPVEGKVKEVNKWTKITETFKIPANMDPKYNLKFYILSTSKEEIFLDDFKLDFY